MMSLAVKPSFASLSGRTQIRIAYGPAPKSVAVPTPGLRESASITLIVV